MSNTSAAILEIQKNLTNDYSIKCFRWDIAIQIGGAINVKEKGVSLMN